ncbi:MAG: hypothetical protein QOE27_877, partial [Solirubrobacteraceae bacterium]|nr:hypothetical protein [Solirubrobacteraceae bacterium]
STTTPVRLIAGLLLALALGGVLLAVVLHTLT